MTKRLIASAMALSLGLGFSAYAQNAPVGGPAAKGNAPLKAMHTVNDGTAKPGANSFTQGQARQHMVNSGYSDVSGLTKGQDGVWRGTASHNGAQVNVAMDFKGNVTEAGAVSASTSTSTSMHSSSMAPADGGHGSAMSASGAAAGDAMAVHHHHHRRHHHGHCANPGPNGAACSGIDTNGSGVSDREENAMHAGAHP